MEILTSSPNPFLFYPIAAFNAHVSETFGDYLHPTINETLVFGDVTSSIGGGYSSKTGVYTCPVDGIYSFSASIQRFSTDTDLLY